MIKILPRNIARLVVLILLQVILFNRMQISGYINPYFYVLFILLLPFETPRWLVLILGFITGITIDMFSETIGMHATACVLMAYARPFILDVIAPRDGYEPGTFPRISYYGFGWFLKYTLILVFIHHLALFYIEVFKFTDFFNTLTRVILSTIFSVVFIILSQFIIFRR